MGNTICNPNETADLDFGSISVRPFKSINEMQSKFKKYAQDNLLGLYSRRMQQAIQKLFTLGQFHICDLLIQLSCQKKTVERDELLQDLQSINLQELDHLTLVQQVPLNIVEHIDNASNIYFNEQTNHLGVRAVEKKTLKGNQYSQQILKGILQSNRMMVITTVQCLGSFGLFSHLDLPTKKSLLEMFIEKIEATNNRYQCALLVVFIVNASFEREFDYLLNMSTKNRDLQSSRDTQATLFDFKYEKILYKPTYPCVDEDRKIIVEGNKLKFQYRNGDFVGFLMNNTPLQYIMQRYEYIQFANVNSPVQSIAQRASIIYLHQHPQIQILAQARAEGQDSSKRECIKLKKNFIETVKYNPQTVKKPIFNFNKSFYLRTSLFHEKQQNKLYHKFISTRIKSETIQNSIINFVRKIEDVLYAPITLIMIVDPIKISGQKSVQIQYSNFCKRKIGLKDTADEQIVDVCPQILFGPQSDLRDIILKLRDLPTIGFPLVINKQRIEQFRGMG